MIMDELSWEPRRRGPIYCSDACGFGCTLAEYKRVRDLAKVTAQLAGSGWRPQIHENLGWHCGIINEQENMSVSIYQESGGIRFTAGILYERGAGAGWRWCAKSKSLQHAINLVRRQAQDEVRQLADLAGMKVMV